jgi:hypothetical protein
MHNSALDLFRREIGQFFLLQMPNRPVSVGTGSSARLCIPQRSGVRRGSGRLAGTVGSHPRGAKTSSPSPAGYSDDQMSIFVRTREITSPVNSLVLAWPPRSGVRTPVAVASSTDS